MQSFIEGSQIPYEVLAHSLAFTAQGVAHASHVSGWQMAKVVVVRPSSGLTSAMICGVTRLDAAAPVSTKRRTVTPVRALQQAAQAIGRGELQTAIDIRTGDELEDLADEFTRMNAQLEAAFAGLTDQVTLKTQEVDYLRQSTDQILDAVPTPIVLIDARESVHYANQAARETFHLAPDATAPLSLFTVLPLDAASQTKLRQEFLRTASGALDSAAPIRNRTPRVLDINMPHVNVFEFCEQLRRMPQYKVAPVIFITANDELQFRAPSVLAGGNDLAKPISTSEVILKVIIYLVRTPGTTSAAAQATDEMADVSWSIEPAGSDEQNTAPQETLVPENASDPLANRLDEPLEQEPTLEGNRLTGELAPGVDPNLFADRAAVTDTRLRETDLDPAQAASLAGALPLDRASAAPLVTATGEATALAATDSSPSSTHWISAPLVFRRIQRGSVS